MILVRRSIIVVYSLFATLIMSFTLAAKYWIAFIESDSEFESDNEIMEICNPTATPTSRAPVEAAAIQQLSGCQDLQQCIYQNGNSLNHPCEENSVQSNTDREVVSIHKEGTSAMLYNIITGEVQKNFLTYYD